MNRRETRQRRTGFTLVELLVVIVIIAILVGLLVPAIIVAVRRANDARVSGDIQTLASGLERFKTTYGEYPPSRVVLNESGIYSLDGKSATPQQSDYTKTLSQATYFGTVPAAKFGTPDISFGLLAERSQRAIRRFFPRAAAPTTTLWHDFNGNGTLDAGFIYLEGHECLVFFLGGIPSRTTNSDGTVGFGGSGFGKNPLYPFQNAMTAANRTLPSYEFRGDRLYDADDNDGIPGYRDPLGSGNEGNYFAYFAAYGSAGYDPNDVNLDDTFSQAFRVGNPVITPGSGTGAASFGNLTTSPSPNPYTSGQPNGATAVYMNAQSFQLISAGGDSTFGPGGEYHSKGEHLPTTVSGFRDAEADNVTNFTSGRIQ